MKLAKGMFFAACCFAGACFGMTAVMYAVGEWLDGLLWEEEVDD